MEVKRDKIIKELIAIEYPGKVENPQKMVETLGGAEDLSKGIQERQKLQLKFRNNFFAKPVLSSEPADATGVLLKVKVRRSKKNPKEEPICETSVVGTVSTIYKFTNFADYQYLPIQRNEKTGETENLYEDLVPQDITAGPAWFREKPEVPIFLPPVAFTRSDAMQPTILKNETTKDTEEGAESIKFAVTNRTSRVTHGISIAFSMTEPIPANPNQEVKDLVKSKLVTQEEFDAIHNLFQERPIWTLASIRAHMRNPPRRYLSSILATKAFYYSTGPWRNCFVRIGYDPRQHFESRFFQMLDYRVRAGAGFKTEVKSRRQTGVNNKRVKVPAKAIPREDEAEENFRMRQREAIFTVDTIPPFRARHYQFIDVHVPRIQEMLEKIPSPLSGALCNEKRGWLPPGFMENCRDILSAIAQGNMQKICNEKNISLEEFKAGEDDTKSETPQPEVFDSDETESDVGDENDLDE